MKSFVRQSQHRLVQVAQGLRAIGGPARIGGKAPGWKVFLDRVHIDVHPTRVFAGAGLVRQPGHVNVQQQTPVGVGQERRGVKTKKAGRLT